MTWVPHQKSDTRLHFLLVVTLSVAHELVLFAGASSSAKASSRELSTSRFLISEPDSFRLPSGPSPLAAPGNEVASPLPSAPAIVAQAPAEKGTREASPPALGTREAPPASNVSSSKKKQRSSSSGESPSQAQFMEAIAAKRHGGGKQEGIIAGVVFSCIFAVLFSIGTAYIYVTRRYNIDRASERGGSFRSEIDGAISAAPDRRKY